MYDPFKSVSEISYQGVSASAFFFRKFSTGTYSKYPIIFGDENDRENQRELDPNPDPKEIVQRAVDFYYSSIMLCSGDDILKVEPVLKLSLNEVLGYLSYRIDKANKARQKEQNSIS
jgi:hypothetical protein